MAEFKVIETQEELNAIMSERLTRQKNQHEQEVAGLNRELETLREEAKKYADYDKTLKDAQAQLKKYETASVKAKIAHEIGIPYELEASLIGETEEEIRTHAELLGKFIRKGVPPLASSEEVITEEDASRKALRGMLKNMNKGE